MFNTQASYRSMELTQPSFTSMTSVKQSRRSFEKAPRIPTTRRRCRLEAFRVDGKVMCADPRCKKRSRVRIVFFSRVMKSMRR